MTTRGVLRLLRRFGAAPEEFEEGFFPIQCQEPDYDYADYDYTDYDDYNADYDYLTPDEAAQDTTDDDEIDGDTADPISPSLAPGNGTCSTATAAPDTTASNDQRDGWRRRAWRDEWRTPLQTPLMVHRAWQ